MGTDYGLAIDKHRGDFQDVPDTHAYEYKLVRFLFLGQTGYQLFPDEAPEAWVREVSDPAELGAIWFYEQPDDRTTGELICARYMEPNETLANDGMWSLESFGGNFGFSASAHLYRLGREATDNNPRRRK